ncbi:TonB-linked outer membrane protein, SusC/RagA family [Sinomicrobium oceani]|uniref:TonB-linked outer membrane protein, SusC/RagA family n=1 Tax=Sinomicrobium oceani TaxID=1150368 RepID=A0A1K1M4Z8_9FLAO|nr:TonB-dependent receptor [Sinomicrobium oceani]SFW18161.1 TonB-linked outer membrane protein, SusC/RagA family [Sinomicrobium oceani]
MKNLLGIRRIFYYPLKFDLKMKIATLFVIFSFFQLQAFTSYGQRTKVKLHLENEPLESVFEAIEAQTAYKFFYNLEDIDTGRRVTVRSDGKQLGTVLKEIFDHSGTDYKVVNEQIVLTVRRKRKTRLSIRYLQDMVRGTVSDEKGMPLFGVTVLVKGANIGTNTDENGYYQLSVREASTLIFSMVGFESKEVAMNGRDEIDVVLTEENTRLDEVVVTGYNTIKKEHVASSVSEMNMDRAVYRPIFKLEEAFSGTLPGVTMQQSSNLPGSVPGNIAIRGISTLQNGSPLVIVDGMEQSLTDIDPNQVKSISVLKDAASASLYGSRGANGVIIIETKRGVTDQFKVDIHSWTAISDPIDLPEFVGSADYMRLNNEARTMQGQSPLFTEEQIGLADRGEYTDRDWLDEVMERRPLSHNTSASISGGGGVGTFNLMLGYITDKGLNNSEGSEKFSARFNTNINIADKFVLMADFYAHRLQVDRLMVNNDGHGLYRDAWKMNPTQDIFYDSDLPEHYVLYNNLNPVAAINHGGMRNNMYDRSTINLRPTYYINESLSLNGNVSYMINKSAWKEKRSTFKFFDGDGKPAATWANSVNAEQGVSVSQITARANLNYEKKFRQQRDKMYFIAGSEIMTYNYTDYREVSKASFFGKLNYSFDNRYILEMTGRTDGSSKFAPGHRWGFFPSAALAWNVHHEKFLSGLKDKGVINNLKFRLSYGLIGNENVDPYLWQEVVNEWGWTLRVPNPNFTWEKQKQGNIGLDLTVLNNRLNLTAELYSKHSYDLIYSRVTVPPLTGSDRLEAAVNIGEVENKGWEVSARWSDRSGDFSYSIGGMLFDNKNKVLKAGYSKSDSLIFKDDPDKIWYRGIAIDNYYGYESNGYFQTREDVDATEAKLPNTIPGDIRYIDQNGDGIINDLDKVDLGDPFPHLNYSVTLDLRYRRWDLSMLGQGVGRRLGRLNGLEGYPVLMDNRDNNLGTPRTYYMNNRWTPDHPDSRFPRVWTGSSPNAVLSDVWLSNAAYFRIKTLQVGYTIPKIGKNINNFRLYLNAQDAFTFTRWEGLDPERDGGNGGYPRMATYSIGLRFTIL